MAFLGVTAEVDCSIFSALKYCLIIGAGAGFPTPSESFHSFPRPWSIKIARIWPIKLSTEPAERRKGQSHSDALQVPQDTHFKSCTGVLPFKSLWVKSILISLGKASSNFFLFCRLDKKASSSSLSHFFCVEYFVHSTKKSNC